MKKAHILLSVAVALFTFAGFAQGQVISQNMKALARSGTALVGLSGADGTLKRSTDGGSSFSTVFTPSGATLQNVVASGTTVIAVGGSGYIVRSTDSGATFTALDTTAAPATLGNLYDATTSNGTLWVAVGKSATGKVAAAYSTNSGATWVSGSIPANTGELRGVVYDSTSARWSAVGTDSFAGAALYTSTDGQNWTAVTVPTLASSINDVASNGAGNLLAVGDAGTMLTSSNGGSTWAFEANSGIVSQNLYAVVYSSTSTSFTAGGAELVQLSYTVAGGSTVTQQPVASGGDITTLITNASGGVITGGGLYGYQTITFAGPGDQLMTASPVTLSATASSGLTVSFRVLSGSASVSGNQLTLTGTGSVTVEAYQNGGTTGGVTYLAAASIQRTLNVTKASATVSLGALTATYDGTTKSATVDTTPSSLTVVVTYDGSTTAPTNAGSYAVSATITDSSYTGSATGTLVIAKADQTITFAGPGDQLPGGAPIALVGSATSGLPITYTLDSGPATLTGNTLSLTGVGTVTVTASQGGNGNYNAATSVTRSFVVTGGFEAWRAANFNSGELSDLNISGPNAILAGDGLTNLLKYALGLDPRVAGTSSLPTASATSTDWTFTFVRPTSTTDVTYEVEASTDLAVWSSTGVTVQQVSSGGGMSTWTATFSKSLAPTKVFFRLKVTLGAAG